MSKHQEFFPVLSIERDDINVAIGYFLGPGLTDEHMQAIASKFGDALLTLDPYDMLTDVVESWLESENDG